MPTTYEEAYETITDHLRAQWPVLANGIAATVPDIRFAEVETGQNPQATFIRFAMMPVLERQATFRNGDDKRYTSNGVLFVQVYIKRPEVKAAEYLRRFSAAARNVFRGVELDGCIWFRNVRINNLEPTNEWYRANVIADYEYDEIG
jgi:hypothetical protein